MDPPARQNFRDACRRTRLHDRIFGLPACTREFLDAFMKPPAREDFLISSGETACTRELLMHSDETACTTAVTIWMACLHMHDSCHDLHACTCTTAVKILMTCLHLHDISHYFDGLPAAARQQYDLPACTCTTAVKKLCRACTCTTTVIILMECMQLHDSCHF
jgi:hypothetical protein